MKGLTFHLFEKDVRHLRVMLLVWLLLIGAQAVLIGSGIGASSGDFATIMTFQIISFVLPMLRVIVLVVLIPLLVHGEPLTGTTAFWLSRPLSRRTILAAKGLFIGLLLVLIPLLTEVAVFAGNGVQVHHILAAVPEILLGDLALILQVMVLAVLTRSFARFAIAGVTIFIAMILLAVLVQILRLYFGGMDSMMKAAEPGLAESRNLVGSLIVLVFGTAVVLNQYLTRKTGRSVALAALGIALQLLSTYAWSINFFALEKKAPEGTLVRCEDLVLTLDGSHKSSSDEFQMRRTEEARKQISMRVESEGLADVYFVRPSETVARLTYSDGTVLASTNRSYERFMMHEQDMPALRALFNEYEVLNGNRVYWRDTTIISVPSEQYFSHGRIPAELSLEVEAGIYTYRVAAELPLREGERYAEGSEHLVISRIMMQSSGCTVILRESRVNLLFGGADARSCSASGCSPQNKGEAFYVLRNRERKQIYMPSSDGNVPNMCGKTQRLSVTPLQLVFQPNTMGDADDAIVNEEWLKDAELLRVERVDCGYCRKTIEQSDFLMVSDQSSSCRYTEKTRDGPDAEVLAAIVLPENPTRDDVIAYVRAIRADAEKQRCLSSRDLQVDKLIDVGPEHLDVLLLDGYQYHALEAVKRLAGPEHKELIIGALAENQRLVDVVVRQGWEEDVRGTLLAELKKNPDYLPESWIRAVASWKDTNTCEDLKAYFVRGRNRGATYEAIRDMPGMELDDAVDKAWRRVRYDGHDFEREEMIPVVVRHGHTDALREAAQMVREKPKSSRARKLRKVLPDVLPEGVTVEDFPAWYEAHSETIHFDATTRRYEAAREGPQADAQSGAE